MAVRWVTWVAFEWALILTALAVAWHGPWWTLPACMLVMGARMQALIVLGHEVAHQTLGRGRLEWAAGPLCFWPFGADLIAYRAAHLAHHRSIGLPADPEMQVRARRPWAWLDLSPRKRALLITMDLCGLGLREAWHTTQPVVGHYTAARVAVVGATILAALAAGLWPLLLLWGWTLGTVTMALSRVRSWHEHCGLPPGETHDYVARWWQRALWCPHYVWRHAAHHAPGCWSVPCWRLA